MFGKYDKLEREIEEIKVALVGHDTSGNSFKTPAEYSALAKLKSIEKQQRKNNEIMHLLLDKLGLSLEKGTRLVKKKKPKK